MDVDDLTALSAALPGAWPDNPWGHEHPVFKVGPGERGKIFVFCRADGLGVKCGSREEADEWVLRYPDDVSVMAYIGRSGWNDLRFGGAIADDELIEALHESYRLVVEGLPKKYRPAGWDDVGDAGAINP